MWVAERGVTKGRYSTVEIYFSHENWTVEIEVFNKVRQVPMGVSTYVANAVSSLDLWQINLLILLNLSDGHVLLTNVLAILQYSLVYITLLELIPYVY